MAKLFLRKVTTKAGDITVFVFPQKKIAIIIMTNNDNGESIFKELLAAAIGDVFTPWKWQNYVPYLQNN